MLQPVPVVKVGIHAGSRLTHSLEKNWILTILISVDLPTGSTTSCSRIAIDCMENSYRGLHPDSWIFTSSGSTSFSSANYRRIPAGIIISIPWIAFWPTWLPTSTSDPFRVFLVCLRLCTFFFLSPHTPVFDLRRWHILHYEQRQCSKTRSQLPIQVSLWPFIC